MKKRYYFIFLIIICGISLFVKEKGISRYQKAYHITYLTAFDGIVSYSEYVKGVVFFRIDNDTNEYIFCDHHTVFTERDLSIGMKVFKDRCSFMLKVNNREYDFKIINDLYITPECN